MEDASDFELRVRQVSAALPKVELHLHLDGSLSPSFIARRAQERRIALPCDKPADIRKSLVSDKLKNIRCGTHFQSEGGNWAGFDWCNQFLQTHQELCEATFELADTLHRGHNVWVAEIRFCPTLHTKESLSEDAAVAAVVEGFQLAQERHSRLRGGIILCALRSMPIDHFEFIFGLAHRWLGNGVVGADVAGDEASYPLDPFLDTIQRATTQLNLPMTIHAGEWVPSGESNLLLAVQRAKVRRIGHGLILGSSSAALQAVLAQNVAIEVCLTSNIGGGEFKCAAYADHPVKYLLGAGVPVAGFNSDNLLLSGTIDNVASPTNEVACAVLKCGLSIEKDIPKVMEWALEFSFDPRVHEESDRTGKRYKDQFRSEMEAVFRTHGFSIRPWKLLSGEFEPKER